MPEGKEVDEVLATAPRTVSQPAEAEAGEGLERSLSGVHLNEAPA